MYIHGYYYNQKSQRVDVEILTRMSRTQEVEIQPEEGGDIFFTDDPVETETEVNDTFDHLLMTQASIRLMCRRWVKDFFCQSCREAVVNIMVNGETIFAGFIQPLAFSQGYNEEYDEVELTCVDCLSALQYSYYRNIGMGGVTYAQVKAEADQRSFLDLMKEMLTGVTTGLDIEGGHTVRLWYDGSKSVDEKEAHHYTVLQDLSIDELLFLGDEEDDTWYQQDVMEELMKYLNLHIRQEGFAFYIYDWNTARQGGDITFKDLLHEDTYVTLPSPLVPIHSEIVADCDTEIELAETYNQLILTDSVTEVENVIENPLDSDGIKPAYPGKQLYMREYISYGKGKSAHFGWLDMIRNGSTDYDAATQTDWYMWVKKHNNWKFYLHSNGNKYDIMELACEDGTHQEQILLNYLRFGIGAALVATGSVSKTGGGKRDNSPITSIDMKDSLVVSVNGTCSTLNSLFEAIKGSNRTWPATAEPLEETVRKSVPVAEYTGNVAGGNFSPADDATTNYFVVSGKMTLVPAAPYLWGYSWIKNGDYEDVRDGVMGTYWTLGDDNPGIYVQEFLGSEKWDGVPQTTNDVCNSDPDMCFRPVCPSISNMYKYLEFKYSSDYESGVDDLSKVPILKCMLVIGDKCVVEKGVGEDLGTGVPGTGNGKPEDFVWVKYKPREECATVEEWAAQCFTIGVDPKIDDKLIGKEFDIQKNVDYTSGFTTEGTAIPIKRTDHVSGQVKFYILGPVDATWNNDQWTICMKEKTGWTVAPVGKRILSRVQSIVIRDFNVKVASDNGKVGEVDDNEDIVYMSDTKETYVNRKDDLEFKITTALTSEECQEMGVNNAIKLSSPLNTTTEDALLSLYDRTTGQTAKPEQLYVDAYWKEWHDPRITMTQNFLETDEVTPFSLYTHPTMDGKKFHTVGISRNLTEGTATVTMKEISND